MASFSRKDFIFSTFTGFYTGLIAWRILVFLGLPVINIWNRFTCQLCPSGEQCLPIICLGDYLISLPSWWLAVIIPVLWILGVNLGYFLGRWFSFFNQFGKYAAIGFTNAAVYFGVLNILISYTGIATGWWYSAFVTIAFLIGVMHSYFWNKYWAFESKNEPASHEFLKFFVVNIIAAVVNVGTASFVVNGLNPLFSLDQNAWANIGGVAGSAVALMFSFVGFRLIVFRKTTQADKPIS